MTPRRFAFRAMQLAGALALASCFGDSTGPGALRRVPVAIVPRYLDPSLFRLVDFDQVRLLFTRPGGGQPVLDTLINFPASAESITVTVELPIQGASEQLTFLMEYLDQPGNVVVFRAGPQLVTVTSSGGGQTISPVPVYVGVGSNAKDVVFTAAPASVLFGDTVLFTAVARDSSNNPIPNTPIEFTSSDTLKARLPADSIGRVVARISRGPVTITARLLTNQTAATPLQVLPKAAALRAQAGGGQTGAVGSSLATPLTARVLAADSLGVQGVIVSFAVTGGGGTLSQLVDTTDVNGDAAVTWTLGAVLGAQGASASAAGLTPAAVTFAATAVVGAPKALTFQQEPSNANVGAAIAPPVTVAARDTFGNLVTGFTGNVSIAIGNNPGGATLGGTATAAAVAGVATFGNLTVSAAGAGYTLVATSGTIRPDTSLPFQVGGGPATTLVFSTQPPANAVFGTPFSTVVQARDAIGNLATSFTGAVTLAIGTNPAGGTLSGTLVVNAVAGVATFTGISIDNIGVGYTLTANATGLAGTASNPFDVVAAAGTKVWLNTAGGNWSVGANWSGGTIPTAVDTVIITTAGTYTVTVDVAATVTRLVVGAASGTQTLRINGAALTTTLGGTVGPRGALDLSAGSLDAVGQLDVNGAMSWTGGTLAGNIGVRVNPGGTLAIAGAGVKTLTGPLLVGGTGTWSQGDIQGGSGASLGVSLGGVLDVQGARNLVYTGGTVPTFGVAAGSTVRKSGTGTFSSDWAFDFGGTLDLQQDTLRLTRGGHMAGPLVFGTATVLELAGSTFFTTASTFSASGPGKVRQVSGILSATAGDSITLPAFEMTGGTMQNTGVFRFAGPTPWSGGSWTQAGVTRVLAGQTLTITGAATKAMDTRLLEVSGTVVWNGGAISGANGAGIRMTSGGLFDAQLAGAMIYGGGTVPFVDVQAGGTLRKSGTGLLTVDWAVTQAGPIQLQADTLRFTRGGTLGAGAVMSVATAALEFSASTYTLVNGFAPGGPGWVRLTGATWTIAAPDSVSLPRFEHTAGTMTGTGIYRLTAPSTWSGGSWTGLGVTRVLPGQTLTLSGAGAKAMDSRLLQVQGAADWSQGSISGANGAGITVAVGAVFNLQAAGTMSYGGGTVPTLNIQASGTVMKASAGLVTIDWAVSQAGQFDVQTDTIRLTRGGTLGGPANIANIPSVLDLNAGTFTAVTGFGPSGSGKLRLTGAIMTVAAPDSVLIVNLDQTAGTMTGTGIYRLTAFPTWSGGTWSGTGVTRLIGGQTLTITGAGAKAMDQRTLQVFGTANWNQGGISGANGGGITVVSGGLFNAQLAGTISYGGGTVPVLDVQAGGTFRKSVAGLLSVDWTLAHTGTLQVQLDTLRFSRGGSLGGPATLSVANAALEFSANTFTAVTAFVPTGTGKVRLTGATLDVATPDSVTFVNFEHATGTMTGTGIYRFNGPATWAGGTWSGTGITRVLAGQTLTMNGAAKTLDTRALAVNGTGTWTAGQITGVSAARIDVVGTFTATGALTMAFGGGGTPVFALQGGTFNKGGAGVTTIDWAVTHGGTTNILVADTLRLSRGSTVGFSGTVTGPGGATLDLAGGTFTLTAGLTVNGNLRVSAGLLDLGGRTLAQTGNLSTSGTGGLRMATAAVPTDTVRLTGSVTFGGSGSTLSAGTMRISGDFTQTGATGAYAPTLGGTHVVLLDGNVAQNVSFANPTTSFFDVLNVQATNVRNIVLQTDVLVRDSLRMEWGTQPATLIGAGTTQKLTVNGVPRVNNPGVGTPPRLAPPVLEVLTAPQVTGSTAGYTLTTGYNPDTVVFSGAIAALPSGAGFNWKSIRANTSGNFALAADTVDNLSVSSGAAVMGAITFRVLGNLSTTGTGRLTMQTAGANLAVVGNASFQGGSAATFLTNGTLSVAGDFSQGPAGNLAAFAATGSHRTILNGAGNQNLSFSSASSFFDVLEVASTATRNIVLQGNVITNDSMLVLGGASPTDIISAGTSQRLTVLGTLRVTQQTSSPLVRPAVLEIDQDPSVDSIFAAGRGVSPDTMVYLAGATQMLDGTPMRFKNVRVATNAVLTYNTAGAADSLLGELVVDGTSTFSLTGGTLNIQDDLVTQSSGVLRMQTAGTQLTVGDSAIFGGGSTATQLTAGTLTVRGNFVQGGGNAAAFAPSTAHVTQLAALVSGTSATVSFANPTTSFFDSVQVDRGTGTRGTLTLLTDVRANRGMRLVNSTDVTGPTSRVTITGGTLHMPISTTSPTLQNVRAVELSINPNIGIGASLFSPDTTVYALGAGTIAANSSIQYKSIRIAASCTLATDTISGDLHIGAGIAQLVFTPTIRVRGKLRTTGTGVLSMGGGTLSVADSAIFAGGASSLTAGTLRLHGAFRQGGGATNAFVASGSHVTEFAGDTTTAIVVQGISMADPGTSRFNRLQLARAAAGAAQTVKVNLLTSVVTGSLVDTSAGRNDSLLGTGAVQITVDTMSLTNTVFNNVNLVTTSNTAPIGVSALRFENMNPATIQFTINRNGAGASSINGLVFATVPTTGAYLSLSQAAAAAYTLTVTGGSPAAALMNGLYTRSGPTLPTLSWNGTNNP